MASSTQADVVDRIDNALLEAQKLRELAIRDGMTNTAALVAAYNEATEKMEVKLLRRWLDKYITWFVRQDSLTLSTNIMQSYGQLAQVRHRGRWDRELPKQFFFTLVGRIDESNYAICNTIATLEHTLSVVDPFVMENKVLDLVRLAQHLMDQFDPKHKRFMKAKHIQYGMTLMAFHQTLALLNLVAPDGIALKLYHTFLEILRELEKFEGYYPFVYYVRLVKHSVKNLKERKVVGPWMKLTRRQFHGINETLCVLQHQVPIVQFDLDVTHQQERSVPRLMRTLSGKRRDKWTHDILALLEASKESLETGEFRSFKEQLQTTRKVGLIKRKDKNEKMLRYCIICQLRTLVVDGRTETCRQDAMVELLKHGVPGSSGDTWTQEPDIFEAILDALYSIYLKGEQAQLAETHIRSLTETTDIRLRAKVIAWTGRTRDVDDILSQRAPQELRPSDKLFEEIRETMGSHLKWTDVGFNIEELKGTYTNTFFAKVASVFNEWSLKHVKDFEYHIVRYEEVPFSTRAVDVGRTGQSIEVNTSKQRIQTSVPVIEMFRPRPLENGQALTSKDRKYLLVGNAGSGKTSMGKSFAYGWATGSLGQEFNAVYLLSVRELTDKSFDNGGQRKMRTLTTAMATLCFPRRDFSDGEYKALMMQIDDDLNKPTTLVIIDGIDEADSTGKYMMDKLLKHHCYALFTGRPYKLFGIRSKVGNELECLGLTDEQLIRFVHIDAPKHMNSLLKYLRIMPSLWELAHIPLSLIIFCTIWEDEYGTNIVDGEINWNHFTVYDHMIRCVWERYLTKLKNAGHWVPNRDKVFDGLERLAFHASQKGQVLMTDRFVVEYAPDGDDGGVLRQAGFILKHETEALYHFPHLSIHKFFVGHFLCNSLYKARPSQKEKALTFIGMNKYKENHLDTLSFTMQAVIDERGESAFGEVLSVLDEEPRDLIGVQHIFLKLRMIEAFLSIKDRQIEECESYFGCIEAVEAVSELFLQLGSTDEHLDLIVRHAEQSPITTRCFPKLVQPLVDHLLQEPKEIRLQKLDHIARLARNSLKVRQSFEQILRQMFKEEDSEHRMKVITNLVHFIDPSYNITEFVANLLNEGRRDSSECVRAAAIDAVEFVVRSRKTKAINYLKVLVDGCSEPDPNTRARYFGHVAKCTTYGVDLAKAAWNLTTSDGTDEATILDRGLDDENEDVRQRAMEVVFEMACVIPVDKEPASVIQQKLSKRWIDLSPTIRCDCVRRLPRLAKTGSENAAFAWMLLVQSMKDTDAFIRVEALQQMIDVAKAANVDAASVREQLELKFTDDEDCDVRIAAMGQTVVVSEIAKDSENVMAFLEKACVDQCSPVREEACRLIAIVAQVFPDMAESVLQILKTKCTDDGDGVRGKAIRHYLELSHLNDSKGEISEVVALGSADAVAWIREETANQERRLSMTKEEIKAEDLKILLDRFSQMFDKDALEALTRLAEIEKPEPNVAASVIEVASKACRHSDDQIRLRGMMILGTIIKHVYRPEAVPDYVKEAVKLVLEATTDASTEVKDEARKLIQVAPFVNLFDYYWSSHDEKFVDAVADRLVTTAITFTPIRDGTMVKFFIYEGSEEIMYRKKAEEMHHLISIMKSIVPGIQNT